MAIEFKPGFYYVAQWYLELSKKFLPPNGGNMMGCLWRPTDSENNWTFRYRHRYYVDLSEPVAVERSNDIFSWYEFGGKGMSEEQMVERIAFVFGVASGIAGGSVETFWIRGDAEKWFSLVQSAARPKWMCLIKQGEGTKGRCR